MTAGRDEEKSSAPPSETPDVIIVDWDGPEDSKNPYNWSSRKKWLNIMLALVTTYTAQMNGTMITVAHDAINSEFHVSDSSFPNSYWPVASWTMGGVVFSLLILPIMEDFGIRRTFLITHFCLIIFIIPQALARNFATLVVVRFFAGGCVAVLGNGSASIIGNMFETEMARTKPVAIWIVAYLGGSSSGPVVGASIFQFLSWRWISYLQLIWCGVLCVMNVLLLKETRGTVILQRRARSLRAMGKNAYTRHELQAEPISQVLLTSLRRPLKMLCTEYVVFFATLWSAFTVGTLYLFTQSVEQVFVELYDWTPVQAGYVQAAIVIGEVCAWLFSSFSARLYFNSAKRNTEIPGVPIPEARLYLSIGGGIFGFAGGMFVYGWTSYPSLPWIAPAVGLWMVGLGSIVVVSGIADYAVDAYSKYAGSAMACFVVGENTVSAFLPLATSSMYRTLGFQWASTLLACISLLLTLAPLSFIVWGRQIRQNSPFMAEAMLTKQAEIMHEISSGSPREIRERNPDTDNNMTHVV
ncbi:MFS multidrug transporter [Aspergillus heteromorphus CBS 117.55]|uniref:MFS multidrug transporter n=1 Tax=Aspergillus heteromorphus CBS 117.55 TaxID=1448321 RepID=A0A317WKB8_9EURO|nr:MFS multidrug transporter [Aspergillus heteromorphus CBS 117.55]PWY86813.1 MFS multidrug transporter [Aspergillus heteromorphus CBS 117.55]